MPKNKRLKYERVNQLPNVTVTPEREPPASGPYPWTAPHYAGMPVVLELGCGKGEHSLAFAAADSRRLFVGVDYKSHRMCVGAQTALARGLDNVLFLRARVEGLRDYFAAGSIEAIWLTFPDPQLKNRKVHTRLSAPAFLDIYAGVLASGGKVHLKTDSKRFFDYTRQSVRRWGGKERICCDDLYGPGCRPDGPREVISAYETAALSRGKVIRYLAFTLA
ncbi:MAG TPA: tRNA (guanosine(46)-N7)-methyltransferase TrmB [Desulfosarcina sp.]|nr:tRNA (guanosine(46)-N7)-methyltransferase TrmB [Desulfosarcina sp.]